MNLTVYDLLGKEVDVLVDDTLEAGVPVAPFSGAGLASVLYFYQLKAGTFVETRNLVLLR